MRQALIDRGYPQEQWPGERPLRDILKRMNYRLQQIQKGKPLKKTDQTEAIFAHGKQVRQQARKEPETLEISMALWIQSSVLSIIKSTRAGCLCEAKERVG